MSKYQKGKIYKITSNQTDSVYIGSTCDLLCKRMVKHRGYHRAHLAGHCCKVRSFDILIYDDATITLVEDCPCENKEQLLRRERFHIENTPNCINKNIPTRTQAEYLEYHRIYREKNKDIITEKKKAWCEANKQAVAEKKKAYFQANKNAIAQKRDVQIECACGGKYTLHHKSVHFKSHRHRTFAEAKKDDAPDWLDELVKDLNL